MDEERLGGIVKTLALLRAEKAGILGELWLPLSVETRYIVADIFFSNVDIE